MKNLNKQLANMSMVNFVINMQEEIVNYHNLSLILVHLDLLILIEIQRKKKLPKSFENGMFWPHKQQQKSPNSVIILKVQDCKNNKNISQSFHKFAVIHKWTRSNLQMRTVMYKRIPARAVWHLQISFYLFVNLINFLKLLTYTCDSHSIYLWICYIFVNRAW